MLDGACRIRELVKRAAELEMPAVTITDHGSLAGAVELVKAAGKTGVKPIIGCEVYMAENRRERARSSGDNAHLTLLAESLEGYHNLVKLVSYGFLEGFSYKPRIDWELLERHHAGIIALTGCVNSPVNRPLHDDAFAGLAPEQREAHARAAFDRLLAIFGRDNVYIEIQDAGLDIHKTCNEVLLRFHRETGVPLVGTGDVHYLRAEDADPHDALLCIQTGKTLGDDKRLKFPNKEFFFKTPEEMARDLSPWGVDLLSPTLEIAERCDVRLAFGDYKLPRFEVPGGEDAFAYLTRLCEEGLARRYATIDDGLRHRLAFELQTIREMGFADYFLIVWDFIGFAKGQGIGVGPGRGSAAGSLVAYCLAITDVDPIRYDLLFERFLNPGRKSMPDIDIDFSVVARERVMSYVVEKYGRERVAQIITFGKLAAKASVRDTARVLGLPFSAGDKVAKMIPDGPKVGFEQALAPGAELRTAYDADEPLGQTESGDPVTVRTLVDMARPLEGLIRNDSIHAAAVVIGDRDLTEYVPLQRKGEDKEVVTQYAMGDIEALGLLKMDFLGLRNLDVIDDAVRLIAESTGTELDMSALPLDDPATYALLQRGDADGVFQFESSGMKSALREVGPTEFDDLIALVALYRPGPMANIPTYAKRKRKIEPVRYADPRLEPILGSTYGVYIYQEQAMQIAKELAGFTPADADDLRKAIGKKNAELMASLKPRFLDGCEQNGVDRGVAESMWLENERSAEYSFNKSHAACYALISYRTAYLKANYPAEYMAALISSVMDTKDKVPQYVAEANAMAIDVLPPDVNESQRDFAVVGGKIRFGLNAVKNVGELAVKAIIDARAESGPFRSIWDVCERVDAQQLTSRVLESLIKAGALDSTGATRRGMLEVVEGALAGGRKAQADRLAGQANLFDMGGGGGESVPRAYPAVPPIEADKRELLAWERDVLGLYVSSHPLADVAESLRRKADCKVAEIAQRKEGEQVAIGGIVAAVRSIMTKSGQQMAFLTLEDMTGSTEVTLFAKTYRDVRQLLEVDRIVVVRGRVELRGSDPKLVGFEVVPFEQVPEVGVVRLRLDARTAPPDALRNLKAVVEEWRGDHPVIVELATSAGQRRLRLGPRYKVRPEGGFWAEIKTIVGDATLVS